MKRIILIEKRIFLFIIFMASLSYMHSQEMKTKILNESNYRSQSDWNDIKNIFTELIINYKIQKVGEIPFVVELIYYGKTEDNKKLFLGSFSKENGFLNSEMQEFVFDEELKKNSQFFTENLLGLSMDCLEKPFSLRGIVMSSDYKIYETETLCRLSINCKRTSIEEWFPDL